MACRESWEGEELGEKQKYRVAWLERRGELGGKSGWKIGGRVWYKTREET